MSLYMAFPIILCLANRGQPFVPFGFYTASLCFSSSSEWVCSKIQINFNQNHRNFIRIIIDGIYFSTVFQLVYNRMPWGESPSITRPEWQREIDQIISRQTLLWYTEEIYLRCNKYIYISICMYIYICISIYIYFSEHNLHICDVKVSPEGGYLDILQQTCIHMFPTQSLQLSIAASHSNLGRIQQGRQHGSSVLCKIPQTFLHQSAQDHEQMLCQAPW